MHDFNSCSEINHFNFLIFVYLQSSNLASSNVIPLLLEPLQQIPKYSLLLKVKYLFKFQYIIETFIAHVIVTDLMVIFFSLYRICWSTRQWITLTDSTWRRPSTASKVSSTLWTMTLNTPRSSSTSLGIHHTLLIHRCKITLPWYFTKSYSFVFSI